MVLWRGGYTVSEARQRAEEAQTFAADPAASAWVEASAGSGKTKLLTDRLLRLLLAGVPPGRILCLTFTKAGATVIGMTAGNIDQLEQFSALQVMAERDGGQCAVVAANLAVGGLARAFPLLAAERAVAVLVEDGAEQAAADPALLLGLLALLAEDVAQRLR